MRCRSPLLALATLVLAAVPALAQPDADDSAPAFSLSTSQTFTTRDSPHFYLTFRQLTRLDFRVYRVVDAAAFFAALKDPHQVGSYRGPDVPVEKTWLERITDWKRRQRREIRTFVRDQVSFEYRAQRRAARDQQQVAQRVTLDRATFAQVPLLNAERLVTSWREMLPSLRDSDLRRIPLDVHQPGIYVVEAVTGALRAYTVVMVTDLGLVTKAAPGQMLVFAANRLTGEPRSDCDVRVRAGSQEIAQGTTSADGVLDLRVDAGDGDSALAIVQCGSDVAVTDPGGYYFRGKARELLGYLYTDKPIYRPGHTVHVKGILRWRERDAVLPFDGRRVELTASDEANKVIFRQGLDVDRFGAIDASFPVPAAAALGSYALRVTSGGEEAFGTFEVQEYRRPEFETIVTPDSRFVVQGREIVARVRARYYFGQPVANGRVRYTVARQQYYSPLRWSDSEDAAEGAGYWYSDDQTGQGELRLDARGEGEIRLPATVDPEGGDYSLRIEARTMDASSRETSGTTTVHVTHGSFLLTTTTDGYVARPGQELGLQLRAVDYTGSPEPRVAVNIEVAHLQYASGYYSAPTATVIATEQATLDDNGLATARVRLGTMPGIYRIRSVALENGRRIVDETNAWVSGALDSTSATDQYLELIADKRSYVAGDVARLIVRGDAPSGPILVTKEGQSVTWHRVVRAAAGEPIEVPITAEDGGDIYVGIVYMRDGRLSRAERRLAVPPVDRLLTITVTPDQPVAKPQQPGVFTVRVADAAGAPVSAQVSLGVIDEAVYAVKADATPDPGRFFYRREYSRIGTTFSREYYFTGYAGPDRLQLAGRRRRPFTLADFKGDKEVQPQVRKDFPDAIYWVADLVTDANGTARVSLKYPDSLTTWRLTARAVTTDTLVGSSVARTTTTKDLIVRLITPRFLTEGDEVVLPTIVHNYRDAATPASIAFAAKGLQPAGGAAPAPVSASIAPAGERRDDWRVNASTIGTASVTASAKTDADSDAVELPIPVQPRGLRRETGRSGTLFGAGQHSTELVIPASANPGARSVRVSLAPSLAGSLLGALDFLTEFPYGCTEQTLSSFLPNVVVTRALAQLQLAPTERLSVLDRQANDGLRRLYDLQHDDGGWGWWRGDEIHPFMTAYALYGLVEASRAGYAVDGERLNRATDALLGLYAEYPRLEPGLKAYVVFVLGRTNAVAAPRRGYEHRRALDDVWAARDRMTAYGRAWLLLALDEATDSRGDELAQRLVGEAQTTGELSFWASERDPLLFDFVDTSVEATATAVRALARRDPRNPLLDRAVRWLMANRTGGFWISTKQTAMALYGLLDLLQARREGPPSLSADVFVNDTLVGSHMFTAASLTAPDPIVVTGPANGGTNRVRIVAKGTGTLYWSATGVYFDTQAGEARSGSRQLAIARRYARLVPVTQRDGTIRYREEPVSGPIRPGDVLTVRLTIAGTPDWRYLLLEDPLPAGVEAVQDTTAYPLEREQDNRDWWWYGPRVEYRDNRTVFFQQAFEQGRYEYVYLVKAISSGRFTATPAQVAPMYVPGVAASSEPLTLNVDLPADAAP